MVRTWVATLLFALPALVHAQSEFEGLDLTTGEESRPKEDGSVPSDAPLPAAALPPENDRPTEEGTRPPLAELDIIREDRVKSVQRKLYMKRHRFELAPYLALSVNDPYYSKVGAAVRAGFYLADNLALSGRFTWMQTLPTDDVRTAKRNFQSRIFFSVPIWSAMANVEWSAVYGKAAMFNSILHFDGYVLGGAGVVNTETSSLPNRGLNVAADLGVGFRFVTFDYLAVNAALINTTYVDQPTGTTKGATQNLMMLHVGVSLFIPFKSTYREAE